MEHIRRSKYNINRRCVPRYMYQKITGLSEMWCVLVYRPTHSRTPTLCSHDISECYLPDCQVSYCNIMMWCDDGVQTECEIINPTFSNVLYRQDTRDQKYSDSDWLRLTNYSRHLSFSVQCCRSACFSELSVIRPCLHTAVTLRYTKQFSWAENYERFPLAIRRPGSGSPVYPYYHNLYDRLNHSGLLAVPQ